MPSNIALSPELEAIASKTSWNESLKIAALVARLKSFEAPVPCDISITLRKSDKDYGVLILVSVNDGEQIVVEECVKFRQTELDGWANRVRDEDLLASAIISIGSKSRLSKDWTPFMHKTSLCPTESPWLQHKLVAGSYSGLDGIMVAGSFSGRSVEPIKTDSSWERYWISVGSNHVNFAFPPEGWTCTLKTSAQIQEEAKAAERSAAAKALEDMQKYVGWTIQSITAEGILISSPCGMHSETISAGHSVWDYGDSSESYLKLGGNSITFD
jgi:hypothetical protein